MNSQNLSLSKWGESENYRYISHIDVINKLRDIYKAGTEENFNEIKTKIERDCEQKKQQASKATTLLNHCRQTLQVLHDQRNNIGQNFKQQAELGKALTKQLHQEVHRCTQDELAMRQLLNELRQQNP